MAIAALPHSAPEVERERGSRIEQGEGLHDVAAGGVPDPDGLIAAGGGDDRMAAARPIATGCGLSTAIGFSLQPRAPRPTDNRGVRSRCWGMAPTIGAEAAAASVLVAGAVAASADLTIKSTAVSTTRGHRHGHVGWRCTS
jgi:hypothetical protein